MSLAFRFVPLVLVKPPLLSRCVPPSHPRRDWFRTVSLAGSFAWRLHPPLSGRRLADLHGRFVPGGRVNIDVVLTFTLDTNCLVALEENRPAASGVRALLDQHDAGIARVRLAATTAAERQRDGKYLPNFEIFQARLKSAGLDHLELLKPVAVFDLTYFDWCVFAGDEDDAELRRIHNVLFSSPYDYDQAVPSDTEAADRAKAEHKWRNRRLDGLGLHCHIRSGGDVYVTSDENFVKATKRTPLAALGATLILSPEEAAVYASTAR